MNEHFPSNGIFRLLLRVEDRGYITIEHCLHQVGANFYYATTYQIQIPGNLFSSTDSVQPDSM